MPSLIDSIESLIIFINLKSNGVDIMREHSLKYPVSSTVEVSLNLNHTIEVDNPNSNGTSLYNLPKKKIVVSASLLIS